MEILHEELGEPYSHVYSAYNSIASQGHRGKSSCGKGRGRLASASAAIRWQYLLVIIAGFALVFST